MGFIRKHRKLSVILLIFLACFLLFQFTYAGYIKNIINSYILETKEFYFNSSVLGINDKAHNINNWDGVNSYTLTIDVNSKKNEVKSTNVDVEYDIFFECSNNVICSVNKDNGIIRKNIKSDTYQLTVTPKQAFKDNEKVTVKTYVRSSSPYEKTLTGTYTIGIERRNFTYSIDDSVDSKYLTLNLTNTVAFYEVQDAFSTYKVGDLISIDNYLGLSEEDKNKCFSAIITLTVPEDLVAIDMTANSYLHNISYETVLVDGYNYIKKYTFKLAATASEKVIFYKYDISKDYTYPIVNNDSIIGVDVKVAE